MKNELREFFDSIGGWKRFKFLLTLRCPFEALYTLLRAYFLYSGFNAVITKSYAELYQACAMFILLSFFLFLYNGTVWEKFASFGVSCTVAVYRRLFGHILTLPLRRIEEHSSGEWFTRLNSDVDSAMALMNRPVNLVFVCISFVNVCVSSVFLLLISTEAFALTAVFSAAHILVGHFVLSRRVTDFKRDSLEVSAQNAEALSAIITCADIAVLYDAREFLLERFEQKSLSIKAYNMKIALRESLNAALSQFMVLSGYLAVLISGSLRLGTGGLTFGGLTAAFQYRLGVVIGSSMFVNSLINTKTALAGVRRVNETVNMRTEEQSGG